MIEQPGASPAAALPHHPEEGEWSRLKDDNQMKQRPKSSDEIMVRRQIQCQARSMSQWIRFRCGENNQDQSQLRDHWASLPIITRQAQGIQAAGESLGQVAMAVMELQTGAPAALLRQGQSPQAEARVEDPREAAQGL